MGDWAALGFTGNELLDDLRLMASAHTHARDTG